MNEKDKDARTALISEMLKKQNQAQKGQIKNLKSDSDKKPSGNKPKE